MKIEYWKIGQSDQMMNVTQEKIFVSLCGNKSPGCVAWSKSNTLAVGSYNSIAVTEAFTEVNIYHKVESIVIW